MKSHHALVIALLCAPSVWTGNSADKASEPLKVFLFAGQSNMAGVRSVPEDLADQTLVADQSNMAFAQGKWLPIAPGNTQNVRPDTNQKKLNRAFQGFGPEISFANRVSKALNEPVGIIKFALGNTGLHQHWMPGQTGNLYEYLSKLVSEASAEREIKVVGMLWMQGERDAGQPQQANLYASNLNALIEAARKDFDNPDLIFIAGRIDMPKFKGEKQSLETVRHAIESTALPNYTWVNIDDLPKVEDQLHLDTRAMEELGNRMADAFLKMYQATSAENP
jgi:hypothetical protein